MTRNIRSEPALAVALFQAALVVAVSFGLQLTSQQMSAIVALAAAAAALLVRQRVTPVPHRTGRRRGSGRTAAAEPGVGQAPVPTPATVHPNDQLIEVGTGDAIEPSATA